MQRLLAYLLAIVYSITANVPFAYQGESAFSNQYYKTSAATISSGSTSGVITTPPNVAGAYPIDIGNSRYWLSTVKGYNNSEMLSGLGSDYTVGSDDIVVAPVSVKVVTDFSKDTSKGTNITLQTDDGTTITITGLEYIYPFHNQSKPVSGWDSTKLIFLKDKKIAAKKMIGKANSSTKISLSKPIKDFYEVSD